MSRPLVQSIGSHDPDNLIFSPEPKALAFGVTVRAGAGVLVRGTVLAREDEGGPLAVLGAAAGPDETWRANCVLAEPVDAGGQADVTAIAYRAGHFNRRALVVAEGYALTENDEENLRSKGILLSDAQR